MHEEDPKAAKSGAGNIKQLKKKKGKVFRNWKRQIDNTENNESAKIYLNNLADELEPKTHCCECTPGPHHEPHTVHIQYPKCKCEKKNYVLKVN